MDWDFKCHFLIHCTVKTLYTDTFITVQFFTMSVVFAHMYQLSLNLNSLHQKFSLTSNYLGSNTVVLKRDDCTYYRHAAMGGGCRNFCQAVFWRLSKKKHVNVEDTSTQLKRCLSTKRLLFIGIGKTVGVGIYVLIGVATQNAGTVKPV